MPVLRDARTGQGVPGTTQIGREHVKVLVLHQAGSHMLLRWPVQTTLAQSASVVQLRAEAALTSRNMEINLRPKGIATELDAH